MYDDLTSFEHKPNPKILQKLHQFWKTPTIFQKPKNLVLMHEMHEEWFRNLTSEETLDLGRKSTEDEV